MSTAELNGKTLLATALLVPNFAAFLKNCYENISYIRLSKGNGVYIAVDEDGSLWGYYDRPVPKASYWSTKGIKSTLIEPNFLSSDCCTGIWKTMLAQVPTERLSRE